MEVSDHELNRRVSGFRIVSIVIGAISLLNLIRWMLAPTSEMEFVNKAQMIVNLCYFLYSLYLFQYLNKSNYSILLSSFIVLYFSYYLIGNYLSNMDNLQKHRAHYFTLSRAKKPWTRMVLLIVLASFISPLCIMSTTSSKGTL